MGKWLKRSNEDIAKASGLKLDPDGRINMSMKVKKEDAPETIMEGAELENRFIKQNKFIELLIANPNRNKVELAKKAGYSFNKISETVSRLMKNKDFMQRWADRKQEIQDKLDVTAQRVAEEYARIAFLDPRDYYEYDQDGGIKVKKSEMTDLKPVVEIQESRSGKGANGKNMIKLTFYNKMDALKGLRDMFGYDKPAKHAHLLAGDGSGISEKGLESAIIGLITGTPQAPSA